MKVSIHYKVFSANPRSPFCVAGDQSCLGAHSIIDNPDGCFFWQECGQYEYLGKEIVRVEINQGSLFE